MENRSKLGMLIRWQKERIILVCARGRYQNGRKQTKSGSNVAKTHEEPTSFFHQVYFGLLTTRMQNKQRYCWQIQRFAWIQDISWRFGPMTWKVMQRKCVERYCELASRSTQQFFQSRKNPCIDNHQFKEEEMGSVGELSKVCSKVKCLYLARVGRLDILWSVNKLARAIAKWTRANGKRSARLIS